jgi:hypothetical protein
MYFEKQRNLCKRQKEVERRWRDGKERWIRDEISREPQTLKRASTRERPGMRFPACLTHAPHLSTRAATTPQSSVVVRNRIL